MGGPYEIEPYVVWPNAESVVYSWLKTNTTGINVVFETDTTFATPSPNPAQTLPLVLVERVTGGSLDPNYLTAYDVIDVTCFGATRADAWNLYATIHAWMLRLTSKATPFGVVDQVTVENGAGVVNYTNPNVCRVITTYGLATRAQSSI